MISWSAVTGATSYNVYRATTEGGPYDSPLASGLTGTSYTDSTAANDTTYYYVATAVDGTGESGFSNEDPATPRDGTFVSGLIGSSTGPLTTTWTLANSPYVVTGTVEVRGLQDTSADRTSTLIIEAGVTVFFEPGTRLVIGQDGRGDRQGLRGRLQATGATLTSNRVAPVAGDWQGIYFADSALNGSSNNFLDGAVVEYAGGGVSAAVVVNFSWPSIRNGTVIRETSTGGVFASNGVALSITDSAIEGGGSSPAVRVLGFSTLTLTGNTLSGGSFPLQIQPNVVLAALSSNTALGYSLEQEGVAIEGGVMGNSSGPQTRTWPGGDLPYIVLGDLEVRGTLDTSGDRNSTLVIGSSAAPATVRFSAGTRLTIGLNGRGNRQGFRGRLQATNVTFTARSSSPTPGFWETIYFADSALDGASNNFLDNCVVEYAGANANAAVVVIFNHPEIRGDTIIRHTSSGGVYASNGVSLGILGGEVEGGGTSPAVRVLGFSTLRLTGVTMRGGSHPVQIQPNVVLGELSGNSMEGYTVEQGGVAVEGGIMGNSGSTQTRVWPGGDLPYILLADLEVRGNQDTSGDRNSTLVIGSADAAATVRFSAATRLTIGRNGNGNRQGFRGRLQATNVTFTARSASPTPGFWETIYFADSALDGATNNFLDNCVVEYAGAAADAAVVVNVNHPEIRGGTIIRETASGGLFVSADASIAVTGGEIEGSGSSPAVRVLGFSTLRLTDVTLRGGSHPVQIQPNVVLAALSGNTMEGYSFEDGGLAVEAGVMGNSSGPQTRTWPGGDLPYILLGDLEVRGRQDTSGDRNSTLVLGSSAVSTTVLVSAATRLTIGLDGEDDRQGFRGRLQATNVTFTARSSSPTPGFWARIYFADSAVNGGGNNFLDGCVVEYAGANASAAVVVNENNPEIRGATIVRHTSSGGVYISNGSSVAITGGEVEGGGSSPAVRVLGFSTLRLTGVTLRGGSHPVQIQPNVVLAALSGNMMEGYAVEQGGVAVEGGVMGNSSEPQSRTWPGGDLPFIVLGDLQVRGNQDTSGDRTSTLIVGSAAAPTVVRFAPDAGMTIGRDDFGNREGFRGRLQATATTFTSTAAVPTPGFWQGFYFADSALDGQSFLDGCVVEGAGGTDSAAAVALNASSLDLRSGTVIRTTGNRGLHLSGSGATVLTMAGGAVEGGSGAAVRATGFSNLSLVEVSLSGGTYPVYIQPNVLLTSLGGVSASGYAPEQDGVAVDGGVMGNSSGPQTRIWPGDLDYIVLGDVMVRGDQDTSSDRTSTLRIGGELPVEVRFAEGTGMTVGLDGQEGRQGFFARLLANNVTFTANSTAPVAGFWKGLYFADSTLNGPQNILLDDCEVRWAGGHGANGAVTLSAVSLDIRRSKILAPETAGVYVTNGSAVEIVDSEVEGGSGPGVRVFGTSSLSLTGSTFRGGSYPAHIQPNVVISRLQDNRLEGYSFEQAGMAVNPGLVGSGGAQTRTWPGGDMPYLVLGDLEVRGNIDTSTDLTSTLILGASATLRFAASSRLFVGLDGTNREGYVGKLQASGVTFTANTETPSPGFWEGIYFRDSTVADRTETYLDRCLVEWAGGGVNGAVEVNNTSVGITGTRILGTSSSGIYLTASSASVATVTGGEIEGGSGAAVRVRDRGRLVLSGNVLRGGLYPVQFGPNSELIRTNGNTMVGYDALHSGFAVDGGLIGSRDNAQTRIWPAGLTYIVLGDLRVQGDRDTSTDLTSTLILGADSTLRFAADTRLFVGVNGTTRAGFLGKLQATGVRFTANSEAPSAGFWSGVYFRTSAVANRRENYLDDSTVEWAGGGVNGSVEVNETTVGLTNTRILGSSSSGLHLTASSSTTVFFTDGEIEGGSGAAVRLLDRGRLALVGTTLRGGTYPVHMQRNSELLDLEGNSMEGYDFEQAGIAVDGGILGSGGGVQTRFWPSDLPYIVLSNLEVRGNQDTSSDRTSTLILGAGSTLRFAPGVRLLVGYDASTRAGFVGKLQATGVTFTANTEATAPGFWQGIYFRNSTVAGTGQTYLDDCTVEWAGGGVAGAVQINSTVVGLRRLRVLGTTSAGVYLNGGSASQVTISESELEGGGGPAVRALNGSILTLTDTTLRGGTFPVGIGPNVVLQALQGNRLQGYPLVQAGIAVDGGVMGSSSGVQTRVWPADLPYIVLGDIEVRGNQDTSSDRTSTLLIQGGGEVRFNAGTGLSIGFNSTRLGFAGRVQATGVTFTANDELPNPGFHKGINFRDGALDSENFLTDCTVEYGGFVSSTSSAGAGITIDRSTPRLVGVTARASSHDGILVANASPLITGGRLVGNGQGMRLVGGGTPVLSGNDIEQNSNFGVVNETGTTFFAGNNWWGDASGPLDASDDTASGGFYNPGGLGNRVSDGVDYNPWLELSAQPPVAPAQVEVEAGGGQVTVRWQAGLEGDLAGYDILRRQPPATLEVQVNESLLPPVANPEFVDVGLVNQTEYCYRVVAVDGQGRRGDPSREVCATPGNDLQAPVWDDLVGVQFVEGGDGTATLRFEPATDTDSEVRYNVYWATFRPVDPLRTGTGRLLDVEATPSTAGYSLEIQVTGLAASTYFFNLQAMDADGNEDGNRVEVSVTVRAAAGALVEQGVWTGANLDDVVVDGDGQVVLASGQSVGQITTEVLELPAGSNLASLAWNALSPPGTVLDTIPGGRLTLEVRAADSPANLADAACLAVPPNLLAWWPGQGNARELAADREAVLRNGATFGPGRGEAQAFHFDGANDYVDMGLNVSETAYTLTLWMKTSCPNCGVFSVDAGTLGSSGHDRHLYLSNGNLCTRVWNTETICTAGRNWSDDAWHHVVHVFGGSVGGQKIFVDGVEWASGSKSSSDFTGQTGVNIGFSNDAANDHFRGSLDQVALFNDALDGATINALYRAGSAGMCQPDSDGDGVADPTDACPDTPAGTAVTAAGCPFGACFHASSGALAWWRGEGDGSDTVGGNDATLGGGATFAPGRVGDAFLFDGSDDRAEVADFGTFTNFSTHMWIYREGSTNARQSIISYKEGDGANCGFLTSLNEVGSGHRPRQFVKVNGTFRSVVADDGVPLNTWTHLAGTYDGSRIRLYRDGLLVASGSFAGAMTQCTQNTGLGARASFDRLFFPGRVDELAVYDRVLSAEEIQAIATAAEAGLCAVPPPPSGAPPGTPQVEEGWVQITQNQVEGLPDGRYVQVRVTLRGDVANSPVLRSLSLGY